MQQSKVINTFILTGFLGSGKTTLLNHLLENRPSELNYVIENEFGKVSVDGNLVEKNYDQLFELNNGCICCSLDSELIEVLAQLIKNEKFPDNLFIEASGVADAGMLAAIFKRDDVSKYFKLQKTICLIDAENFEDRLPEIPEVLRQIVAADIVAINKIDLVQQAYCSDLRQQILSIHPFAEIQTVSFGKVQLHDGNGGSSFHALRSMVNEFSIPDAKHRMKSIAIPLPFAIERDKLYAVLSMKLFLHYQQIYRIKGFVKFKGEDNPVLVQSTGNKLTFTPVDTPVSEFVLVFIGRDIQRQALEKILFNGGIGGTTF